MTPTRVTRLLLVDDDRDLSALLAMQLQRAGYEVQSADSFLSALQLTSEQPPFDVLITDLNLPDADGAAVAQALNVPIRLVLSGSSSAEDERRLMAAGFSAVLRKPISGEHLLAAVAKSVAGARPTP